MLTVLVAWLRTMRDVLAAFSALDAPSQLGPGFPVALGLPRHLRDVVAE